MCIAMFLPTIILPRKRRYIKVGQQQKIILPPLPTLSLSALCIRKPIVGPALLREQENGITNTLNLVQNVFRGRETLGIALLSSEVATKSSVS
jgi:hypothetical protein